MMKKKYLGCLTAAFVLVSGFSCPAIAHPEDKGEQADPLSSMQQNRLPGAGISRFCENIDTRARDAHFELQMRRLDGLRKELDSRISLLEKRRKEYEDWLVRRYAFLARTQDAFVGIISKMQPDAAAARLALVDDMTAASLILKLEQRIASAIMNELQPEKSASLMSILASAQKVPSEKAPVNTAKASPE